MRLPGMLVQVGVMEENEFVLVMTRDDVIAVNVVDELDRLVAAFGMVGDPTLELVTDDET
jgi:hypothetical protein